MSLAGALAVVVGLSATMVLPGASAAWFVLGARRPLELSWMTVLAALFCFTPLVYPAALVAGAPTWPALVVPTTAFAVACVLGRKSLRAWAWEGPRPSRVSLLVISSWCFASARAATLLRDWGCDGDTDVAYFFGMLRELGRRTPAENPELAGAVLTHSSGYWFLYACVQRFSGLGTQGTLWLLGPAIAATLLFVFHRLSRLVYDDERAATFGILLLIVPSEPAWSLLFGHGAPDLRPLRGFAQSLVIAWYDGPALLLVLLVLFAVVRLVRAPDAFKPLAVLTALLVLFPFHHAMYFGIVLCGLLPYFTWCILRRKLRPSSLVVFVTWLPWRALQLIFPGAVLAGDPRLSLALSAILPDLGTTLARHAVLLPLALVGLFAGRTPGTGAVLSVLGVLFLPGPWAGPWNRHWQWDPLELLLALVAGRGLSVLLSQKARTVRALSIVYLLPSVVAPFLQGLFHRVLIVGDVRARCIGPKGLLEASLWLRDHSAPDARIATPPASIEGQYVEVFAARPLVFGDAIHLDMVDPPARWRPVEADMARLYTPASRDEVLSILARHRVDFVVHAGGATALVSLTEVLPVRFRSGDVVVLGVPQVLLVRD